MKEQQEETTKKEITTADLQAAIAEEIRLLIERERESLIKKAAEKLKERRG